MEKCGFRTEKIAKPLKFHCFYLEEGMTFGDLKRLINEQNISDNCVLSAIDYEPLEDLFLDEKIDTVELTFKEK